jgi:hypothetical protein
VELYDIATILIREQQHSSGRVGITPHCIVAARTVAKAANASGQTQQIANF